MKSHTLRSSVLSILTGFLLLLPLVRTMPTPGLDGSTHLILPDLPFNNLGSLHLMQAYLVDNVGSNWLQRLPANHPSALTSYGMTYDSMRGVVVLFGGYNGSNRLAETWEWNGTNWLLRMPLHHPSARTAPALAYDSDRRVVVLFGGVIDGNPPGYSSETWLWDGTDWTESNPANHPSARYSSLIYDNARHVSVLFGGHDGTQWLDETWEWNGLNWIERSPVDRPPARNVPGMAYDGFRSVSVLFGGYTSSGDRLDDTWEWNGTNWIKRTPATQPSARSNQAMTFDSERGVTVLFGGNDGNGGLADTWEWNGNNWIERTLEEHPSERYSHGMAFDSRRRVVVLFGGCCYKDDTWEYGLWYIYLPLIIRDP